MLRPRILFFAKWRSLEQVLWFRSKSQKNDVAKPSDGLAFGSLRRFEIKLAQKNNASVSTYFLTMFFDAVHKKLDMGHWQFHVEVVAFPTRMAIAASR